jgi:hypothetical protein
MTCVHELVHGAHHGAILGPADEQHAEAFAASRRPHAVAMLGSTPVYEAYWAVVGL